MRWYCHRFILYAICNAGTANMCVYTAATLYGMLPMVYNCMLGTQYY